MGNKNIEKISISKEIILSNMKKAGMSFRELAKKTNRSDRTIRAYLNEGYMPEKLIHQIDDVLRPKNNKINVVFTVEMDISDDDVKWLLEKADDTSLAIELCDIDSEYLWDLAGDNVEFKNASIAKTELISDLEEE